MRRNSLCELQLCRISVEIPMTYRPWDACEVCRCHGRVPLDCRWWQFWRWFRTEPCPKCAGKGWYYVDLKPVVGFWTGKVKQ